MKRDDHRGAGRAFTLIELLVSLAILALLMVLLVAVTDSTRKSWSSSVAKTQQFREAREAFEAITRRLSQATLNTYWDYRYPNNDQTQPPTGYVRQSELRFISGTAEDLNLGTDRYAHAVFFQAPLGYVSNTSYVTFRQLLNTWGFFIEYASDQGNRPAFLSQLLPDRRRFRLMELMEPSDSLTLYQEEARNGGATAYTGKEWYRTPLTSTANLAVVAENIIALVILPKLTPSDQSAGSYNDGSLAPNYLYDSTGLSMSTGADPRLNPKNQLPPVLQVTMVAVDERSAARLTDSEVTNLQAALNGRFQDPARYQTDLQELESALVDLRINYRVFTTSMSINAAKWSTSQTN